MSVVGHRAPGGDIEAWLQRVQASVNIALARTSNGAGSMFFANGGNAFGSGAVLANTTDSLDIEAAGGAHLAPVPPAGGSVIAMGSNITLAATSNSSFGVTGGNLSLTTTTSGNVTIDPVGTLNLGTTNAAAIVLGNTANTAAITINGTAATHQTTVGAAGGASNTPAAPALYVLVTFNGTQYAVPFYLHV